jgi:hypothetical protein
MGYDPSITARPKGRAPLFLAAGFHGAAISPERR